MTSDLSVLVVDDDAFVRRTLMRQLESLSISEVAGADSGASAHERIAQRGEPFDVVISDLQMPGEDGLQLLRKLSGEGPRPAVILISSFDPRLLRTAEEIAKQLGVRVLGSVVKPVSTRSLGALLERARAPRSRSPAPTQEADVTPEELMAALAAEQIRIAVQPQLRLADQRVHGVEALARWTRTGGHPVPPSQFIRLAESHHLISPLTDQVVRQAFSLAAHWQSLGLDLSVSVNLAPMSLDDLDFPDRLHRQAQQMGVPSSRLVLEVTESGMSDAPANLLEVLGRLRLAGFGISIDDFGTGYSSLQRLSWVPFTELKIDRSFVMAAPDDSKARSILQSSLSLARDLGLISVAEGVETAAHLELLGELGCDVVQGYYLSRPLPPSELPGWVGSRPPPTTAPESR